MKFLQHSHEKSILFFIPFIFALGSLLHFAFDFFNQNLFISILSPINESIWEHLKLSFYPTVLCWMISYIMKEQKPDKNIWFTSCLASTFCSLTAIPLFYYFYTSAFQLQLLWIDILIFLIAIVLGQTLALHVYRHASGFSYITCFVLIAFLFFMFLFFTFYPPALPLFIDFSSQ